MFFQIKNKIDTYFQKSLFGGLEEFDSSVDESFSLKPNAKRLILKTKVAGSPATASNVQSPAHQPSRFNGHGTPENSRRLNISRTGTPVPKGGDANLPGGSSVVDANLTVDDSFRNQIPTTAPPPQRADEDNARRVSWLHSNALEKVVKQNRITEEPLDNTINELVGSREGSLPAGRNVFLERRVGGDENRAKATMAAHTSSDSLGMGQSFLDDTNADLSLINTEANAAGVILQRSGYGSLYLTLKIFKLIQTHFQILHYSIFGFTGRLHGVRWQLRRSESHDWATWLWKCLL